MKYLFKCLLMFATICNAWATNNQKWLNDVCYSIYTPSFFDFDNNGIGDIIGIKEKLSYINETGFNCIKISDICKENNLIEIDPSIGKNEDLENLIEAAKQNDTKIILEFSPKSSIYEIGKLTEVVEYWTRFNIHGFYFNLNSYISNHEHRNASFEMIYKWRKQLKNKINNTIFIIETDLPLKKYMLYYDEKNEVEGWDFVSPIHFLSKLNIYSTARDFKNAIDELSKHLPTDKYLSWALGNKNTHRIVSRFRLRRSRALNMMLIMLPGPLFIFNGDEIGMEDALVRKDEQPCNKTKDEADCCIPLHECWKSKTAFHWNNYTNANFTRSSNHHIPVSKYYIKNNLVQQQNEEDSYYHHFKNLITLRKNERVFQTGHLHTEVVHKDIFIILRTIRTHMVVFIMNVGNEQHVLDLRVLKYVPKMVTVLSRNVNEKTENGIKIDSRNIILQPYGAYILHTKIAWWYKDSMFYQVFIKTFRDSNGDGVGDLKGLYDETDYFKQMGIEHVILSPTKDWKMDCNIPIDDIDPDSTSFLKDVQENVLAPKIIQEYQLQYTGINDKWFQESKLENMEFKDYYIWKTGLPGPPNNWKNIYGDCAWVHTPERNQYYYQRFGKHYPSLNYRNKHVSAKILNTLKNLSYYTNQRESETLLDNIQGFLIYDISSYFVDKNFENNPIAEDNTNGTKNYSCLYHHLSTCDLAESKDFLKEISKLLKDDSILIIDDRYSDSNTVNEYCSSLNVTLIKVNYALIENIHENSNAIDIKNTIDNYMNQLTANDIPNWMLGYRCISRTASRFNKQKLKGMYMLMNMLPGLIFIYAGEELGLEDSKVANYITPFCWNAATKLNFTENDYCNEHNSFESQMLNESSFWNFFRNTLEIRDEHIQKFGKMKTFNYSSNILIIVRELPGFDKLILIMNTGNTTEKVHILSFDKCLHALKIIYSNNGYDSKGLNMTEIKLKSYDAYIIRGRCDVNPEVEKENPVKTQNTTTIEPNVTTTDTRCSASCQWINVSNGIFSTLLTLIINNKRIIS